jgi:hypothetical protein
MRHGLYPNFAEFDAYSDLEMLFLTIMLLSHNLLQVTSCKSNRGAICVRCVKLPEKEI